MALFSNPIIVREMRARWRGRAFALLLGYVALLCLAMLGAYASAHWQLESRNQSAGVNRMSVLGHDLFASLTWIQTLGWMLLAPALTATSIAGEREGGGLEALQLSPLKAGQIIGGKVFSSLLFIGLLLLVALPVTAVCFLMGGVSPAEFGAAAGLQAGTACGGACVGICCSALTRRGNTAMTLTFIVMIVWFFGSFIASLYRYSPLLVSIGQTNPLLASWEIATSYSRYQHGPRGLFNAADWHVCLGFQLLACPFLLMWAARAVCKPFPEAEWMGATKTSRRGRVDAEFGQSGVWLLPPYVRALLKSENPVFQRELRAKFRLRRLPRAAWIAASPVLAFALYWYVKALVLIAGHNAEVETIYGITLFLGLCALILGAGVMGAGAFSREREAGTWEALSLSLLSAREVLWAKVAAMLLALAAYSIPVWPILAGCVATTNWPSWSRQPDAIDIAATLGVFAATAWSMAMLGASISWRCRRTAAAVGWTIGFLLVAFAFVPAFMLSGAGYSSASRDIEHLLGVLNPVFATMDLNSGPQGYRDDAVLRALYCALLFTAAGAALFGTLRRSIAGARNTGT